MGFTRALVVAIALAGLSCVAGWAATEAPAGTAEQTAGPRFTLDEYSLTASRAPEAWQIAGGLTFGNSYKGDFHLFGGGRVSWVKVLRAGETSSGWALGAIGGIGYRPDRQWSPVVKLALDKLYSLDAYGTRLTASTGIRVRVAPQLDRHAAITFELFGSTLYGSGAVANKSDFGFAVVYSLAFFERI
jgi:hypothetical protein